MRKTALWAICAASAAGVMLMFTGCGKPEGAAGVPDPVATVNGKPVSSAEYISQVNAQAGRQVLQSLLEQALMIQWAENEKVAPTEEQIKTQTEVLKRDGSYDDQFKTYGKDGFDFALKAMQARINLAKKFEKVTPQELDSAYQMLKGRYVHGPRKQVAVILNTDKARVDEAAKKTKGGEDFDKAASEYSDNRFSMGGRTIKIWIEDGQKGLPAELAKAAKDTKVGQVSNVVTIAQPGQPTQYLVLKVLQEQPKSDLKLNQVKSEVEDAVAMQKTNSPDFQQKFNDQKKKASVDIKIESLSDVASAFKNPPPPMPPMTMQPSPAPSAPSAPKAAPKK